MKKSNLGSFTHFLYRYSGPRKICFLLGNTKFSPCSIVHTLYEDDDCIYFCRFCARKVNPDFNNSRCLFHPNRVSDHRITTYVYTECIYIHIYILYILYSTLLMCNAARCTTTTHIQPCVPFVSTDRPSRCFLAVVVAFLRPSHMMIEIVHQPKGHKLKHMFVARFHSE